MQTRRRTPAIAPAPALALAAALVFSLSGVSLGTDEPSAATAVASSQEPAGSALPSCRFGDKKTRFRSPKQWRKTLLDTNLKVGRTYKPTNLVSTSRAGLKGGGTVRSFVIADLRAMATAARIAGKPFKTRSAYRSYQNQVSTFNSWVNQLGLIEARKVSARPGHSEHQLGTTLDLQSAGTNRAPWDYRDWARTKAGRWLKKHAWQYGFVMSYPKGKLSEVCYSYEPWHYRYVGKRLAGKIHDSGLTARRYLWRHFESK